MQRNSNGKRNPYTRSGVPAQNTPGGKRRRKFPQILRKVLFALPVLAILALGIYFLSGVFSTAGQPVRLNALPSYNIQAFGENVLYYDGMSLVCVDPNGKTKWQYRVGTSGDFACTDSRVVAWSDTQLHVLGKDGSPTFTDNMPGAIQFARIGDAYVSVCYGSEFSSDIQVLTHNGVVLEDYTFEDLYVLDIGFFYTGSRHMWVLALDHNSTTPIMNITTWEPGRMSTGGIELPDRLIYKLYMHNNLLMVVDTTKITPYNYRMVEQTDLQSITIYGWQVTQVVQNDRNTYALLEQIPTTGSSDTFSEIRVVTNYRAQSMRFLSPCFASGLTEKNIYGFGENSIYYAPYGATSFKSMTLNYTLTDLVCMLSGNRAVVLSGNEVYIIKLPT